MPKWTASQVAAWASHLGLGRYADKIVSSNVDGIALLELKFCWPLGTSAREFLTDRKDEIARSMGVCEMHHRRVVACALRELHSGPPVDYARWDRGFVPTAEWLDTLGLLDAVHASGLTLTADVLELAPEEHPMLEQFFEFAHERATLQRSFALALATRRTAAEGGTAPRGIAAGTRAKSAPSPRPRSTNRRQGGR